VSSTPWSRPVAAPPLGHRRRTCLRRRSWPTSTAKL
jgi:hypothetical protein